MIRKCWNLFQSLFCNTRSQANYPPGKHVDTHLAFKWEKSLFQIWSMKMNIWTVLTLPPQIWVSSTGINICVWPIWTMPSFSPGVSQNVIQRRTSEWVSPSAVPRMDEAESLHHQWPTFLWPSQSCPFFSENLATKFFSQNQAYSEKGIFQIRKYGRAQDGVLFDNLSHELKQVLLTKQETSLKGPQF